ncbi:MAG: hypothetical protein ACFFAE_10550 [Candidatus Hodarchaeota archaeon]
MRKVALIRSALLILVCSSIITPITSKTSLRFGVVTGDILEWKFTKFEGHFLGDKQTNMLVIWIEFVSTTFPNGSLLERIRPHGLFLGETLTLVVVEIPSVSQYRRFPAVNDDFPKAIFITPRDNESRSTSPYINAIPLIIPKEPDISYLYPNCLFSDQGVLLEVKRTVNWKDKSYNSCLELVSNKHNSEVPDAVDNNIYRIAILLTFLGVWCLSIIYQKRRLKKGKFD